MDTLNDLLSWPIFKIGDTQTTLGSLMAVVAVAVATIVIARTARNRLQGYIQRHHESEADTARTYGLAVQLLIWIVGFEIALHILGIHLTTLFAATGFMAIAAGFAAKNIVENFMSGSILRFERIIRPGDLIVVDGKSMTAQRVGLRTLEARTGDGEEILVPNSIVAQSMVENKTRDDRLNRIQLAVGVSYESDLNLVRKTLEDAVDGLDWTSSGKKPAVYLHEFGDSSVLYHVYIWIDDVSEGLTRKSELHETIWWALKEAGITIAYPQLDLHLNQNLPGSV